MIIYYEDHLIVMINNSDHDVKRVVIINTLDQNDHEIS